MALVLSGGSGERLSVLTAERAVSAIPFGGKYRVIDFVLSNCCHSEIDRVGVITQHAPQSLHDHIGSGRAWDLDRRECVASYVGHADRVLDVDISPDAERIVSASGDETARLWPGDLLATARRSEPSAFAASFGPLPTPEKRD